MESCNQEIPLQRLAFPLRTLSGNASKCICARDERGGWEGERLCSLNLAPLARNSGNRRVGEGSWRGGGGERIDCGAWDFASVVE